MTGKAAEIKGITIDFLLNKRMGKYDVKWPFTSLDAHRIENIRTRLKGARLLIIDEISNCSPSQLAYIDHVLRLANPLETEDKPFGGLHVIISGDMFQLGPVRQKSLYRSAVNMGSIVDVNGASFAGTAMFKKFVKKEIDEQKRSTDPIHTERIMTCRTKEYPFDQHLFKGLKLLKKRDLQKSIWRETKIAVQDNASRIRLNRLQAKRFAIERGEPLLIWYNRVKGKSGELWDDVTRGKAFSTKLPELKRYFVRGAPCMCRDNIDPFRNLANGSFGTLHSLTWENDSYTIPTNFSPGEEIEVPFPKSVNITPEKGPYRKSVVPIEVYKKGGDKGRTKVPPPRIGKRPMDTHCVDLGWVLTYNKVQGGTEETLIIVLNENRYLHFEHIYVGLSRVREGKALRIFPVKNLKHLLKKTVNEDIHVWLKHYDQHGIWRDDIPVATKVITEFKKMYPDRRMLHSQNTMPALRKIARDVLNIAGHNMKKAELVNAIGDRLELPEDLNLPKTSYKRTRPKKSKKSPNKTDTTPPPKNNKKRESSLNMKNPAKKRNTSEKKDTLSPCKAT